jgi:hypothetical protein
VLSEQVAESLQITEPKESLLFRRWQ